MGADRRSFLAYFSSLGLTSTLDTRQTAQTEANDAAALARSGASASRSSRSICPSTHGFCRATSSSAR